MMLYYSNYKIYIAIHMDKKATKGFNIMIYAFNSNFSPNNLYFKNINNRSNKQEYLVWIFVAPTKIAKFTRFVIKFDILQEDTLIIMNILLQAK